MKMKFVLIVVALMSSSVLSLAESVRAEDVRPDKPNVLLLLADDLGWQDVKCYDIDDPSPMETPNIDAFAKKGSSGNLVAAVQSLTLEFTSTRNLRYVDEIYVFDFKWMAFDIAGSSSLLR